MNKKIYRYRKLTLYSQRLGLTSTIVIDGKSSSENHGTLRLETLLWEVELYWSVGWSVCHSFCDNFLKGRGKFDFHAPIGALVPIQIRIQEHVQKGLKMGSIGTMRT